ncbi:MAG: GDSL-type esterase/lipase family protein [Nocardioides sp.]|nr:GDSL-type esterase/lipase family protein [Nocardioides sp.]
MTGRHARLTPAAMRWGRAAVQWARAAVRPGRRRGVALAVIVLACAVGVVPLLRPSAVPARASSAAGSEPLRVMIEGDSITQGFSGDTSWRYWVSTEFRRQRVAVNFVGPHRGTSKGPKNRFGGRYTHKFDSDHAARAGSTLLSPTHLGTIGARTERYDPDVIVVQLGFNDLNKGKKTPVQVARGMNAYVSEVHRVAPGTKVVIGQIMPARYRSKAPRPMNYRAVNSRLARLAKRQPQVTIAKTAVGWNSLRWTTDGVHPNPTGETVLAQRFTVALKRAGVLHAQPQLTRNLAWRPAFTQREQGARGSFSLTWPGQRGEWTITGFRVRYRPLGHHGGKAVTAFTRREGLTVRNLPPGPYAVATTPIRKWMVGTPRHRTRIRVRVPANAGGNWS